MTPPLFLGFDLSTQQLKAILIAEDGQLVHESAVHFDKDLPSYGTKSGAIKGPDGEVTSPVFMWLDAIDLVMSRVKNAGVDMSAIAAISGAGQQHGSVYWSENAADALKAMATKPELSLKEALADAFSIPNAPIWQDSSTTKECRELEATIGGPQVLADITGSRAYERFTGPQIARIRKLKPEAYKRTSRISLVSSFIPSLFTGSIEPIEASDASGMNLMDVLTCKWDDRLLVACGGPELRAKLGPEPVPGGVVLGQVSSRWVDRYGLSRECLVAPFTGDNPATVVAVSAPGDGLLSLGTSTTFLLSIPPAESAPARFTTSHLLSHPTTPEAHIAMLCYKNGALAREHVRDKHTDSDWAKFNESVESVPAGNNGHMGLYFPLPEIIPPGVQGEEFLFSVSKDGAATRVEELPEGTSHARAILESQFLSIRSRITAILPEDAPPLQRLIMTGGGSANTTIRQLAADLFGMRVYVAEDTKEAAGTGGAVLAKFAWWKHFNDGEGTFEEMTDGDVGRMKLVAEPRKEIEQIYAGLVEGYRSCEDAVVRACAVSA